MSETASEATAGAVIARGGRMFMELKSLGEVNDKGKAVLSLGFKGKVIAESDGPIRGLVLPLLGEVIGMARWSDHAAMKADVDALAEAVAQIQANVERLAAERSGVARGE